MSCRIDKKTMELSQTNWPMPHGLLLQAASMPASAERPHISRHRMMYDGKANKFLSFL